MTFRRLLVCSVVFGGILAAVPGGAGSVPSLPGVAPRLPFVASAGVNDPIETFRGQISQLGGKFVLIEDATNATYALDDQAKVKPFDGKRVKLSGALDKQRSTIQVSDIQPL